MNSLADLPDELEGTCEVDGSFFGKKRYGKQKGSLVITDGFAGHNGLPLLGYDWCACNHEAGFFGPTNHIENLWSVIKRALRYIYRDLTFSLKDLNLILREYETRYNEPEVFYNVDRYLKMRACSKFVYRTSILVFF